MKKVALHNLGCKVNSYEIEVMQQTLVEKGYKIVPFDEMADIYIVNTCTVTNIADRKSRQMLHRAKQKNPEAIVVAVGCYVQTGQEAVLADEGIDLAIGNNRKKQLVELLEAYMEEHDKTVAYSLSIPFVSTFVFAAVMKHQDAPGTTFKRHMRIAKGVLNEDDYLLQEILFNPYTHDQVSQIRTELKELLEIIDEKDAKGMKAYLTKIRNNVKRDIEINK